MECIERNHELCFAQHLKCLDNERYIEKFFLYSVSPVLARVKPSTLICFRHCCKSAWLKQKRRLCFATGLNVIELHDGRCSFSVLAYDNRLLSSHTENSKAQNILAQHGYPASKRLPDLLTYLKSRFSVSKYPHEIGVFLGYPPDDVSSFIANGGKDFLCCRYWKVYHHEQKALETFRFIDEARSQAISLLTQQIPINAVAKILKAI